MNVTLSPREYSATSRVPQNESPMISTSNTSLKQRNKKKLSIVQCVLGLLSFGLGIGGTTGLDRSYWITTVGSGIWSGVWMFLTGAVGIIAAKHPTKQILNGFYIAFCSIACVIVFMDAFFFVLAIIYYSNCKLYQTIFTMPNYSYYNYYQSYYYNYYYNNFPTAYPGRYSGYNDVYRTMCGSFKDAAKAIYIILLSIMIVEFFVALTASIYSCRGNCSSTSATVPVFFQQQCITSSHGVTQDHGIPMAPFQMVSGGDNRPMMVPSYRVPSVNNGTIIVPSHMVSSRNDGTMIVPAYMASSGNNGTIIVPTHMASSGHNGTMIDQSQMLSNRNNGTIIVPTHMASSGHNGTMMDPSQMLSIGNNETTMVPSQNAFSRSNETDLVASSETIGIRNIGMVQDK